MEDFVGYNPAKIIFGRRCLDSLAGLVKEEGGSRVLLVYGGGANERNGVLDKVRTALTEAAIDIKECGGITPNPRYSDVLRGFALVKENKCDLILAVGGGSCIDAAKAMGVGLAYPELDLWQHFFMDGNPALKSFPVGVVLTTAATGSESSFSCVISNEEGAYKRGIGGKGLIPRFSLLNPLFTTYLPPEQTAYGCCDIMSHLMERYFTPTQNVDFTDRAIEAGMKTILNFGPRALASPDDYDVRAEIMWTGTIAHNASLSCGRKDDWACHKIEHELSAIYDLPHALGLAAVFPAWMKYVYKSDIDRFVQFAVRVFGVDLAACKQEEIAREGICRFENWLRQLGLSTRLSEMGIDDSRFGEMAAKALIGRGDTIGAFYKLCRSDIEAVYRLAL